MSLGVNILSIFLMVSGLFLLIFALKPFVFYILTFIVGLYLVNYGLKLRRKPSLYVMLMMLFAARSFGDKYNNFR